MGAKTNRVHVEHVNHIISKTPRQYHPPKGQGLHEKGKNDQAINNGVHKVHNRCMASINRLVLLFIKLCH